MIIILIHVKVVELFGATAATLAARRRITATDAGSVPTAGVAADNGRGSCLKYCLLL